MLSLRHTTPFCGSYPLETLPQSLLPPCALSRGLELLFASSLLPSEASAHFLLNPNFSEIKLDQIFGVARMLPGEWVALSH